MNEKKQISMELYAAWLAENAPQLFNQLATAAARSNSQKAPVPIQLSGFTDVLKSIGGSISSAAKTVASGLSTTIKSVGSFLGTQGGQDTLSAVGQVYAASQLSKIGTQALEIQTQRADMGLAPAAINMTYDPATGTYVPTQNGYLLSAGQFGQAGLTAGLQAYIPYILIGGAVLGLVLIMRR